MAARTSISCSTSRPFRGGKKSLAHIMVTGTNGLNNRSSRALCSHWNGRRRRSLMAYGGVFVVVVGGLSSVVAAETPFTPITSSSETYTDNVLLTLPGLERSDWVTQLRAGFTSPGTRRRARVNLSYTPSLSTFARQNKV